MTPEQVRELTAKAVFGPKRKVSSPDGIIVTSHPIVSRVGMDVLRSGGNAVDAALAACVAQTVVEPHMSTIFGMLSLLYYDARSGKTIYLNGSPNAPKAELTSFSEADLRMGRGVAVPGFWAAYEAARQRFASRSSEDLLAPAVFLARDGFPVYPFLYGMMFQQLDKLGLLSEGREVYFRNNTLIPPGEQLTQPALAQTLEQLAAHGTDYFYHSEFTQRVVDTVKNAGGVLTREDFDSYEVRWMEPSWGTYRGYRIGGSPPPDNGGTHLIEILNLIEQIPLLEWGPPTDSVDSLYWLIRFCNEVLLEGAQQRDPRSWPVPLETILSKDYARMRFDLMRMSAPRNVPPYAKPYPGSNHVTVRDRMGNIVTALHSVMSMPWSNGLIVDGVNIWAGGAHFLRQMPKPGDRATCYVAPYIIYSDDGRPILAGGSPSIALIPTCIQNTLNILDFGMDIETSVHRPRFGGPASNNPSGPPNVFCEVDCGTAQMHTEVQKRGVGLDIVSPWHHYSGSYEGIHIIEGRNAEACADPRRSGQAEGMAMNHST